MKIAFFIFTNSLNFARFVWYCVVLTKVTKMKLIKELWHGNIVPQDDSRNNSPEMKQLMEYMARHHDDLLKSMTDEQKKFSKSLMIAGAST